MEGKKQMTAENGKRSGKKWFFGGFLLGSIGGIILRSAGLIQPTDIGAVNSAQAAGGQVGQIIAYGIMCGLVGLLFAKLRKSG
jgi:hypothetical protein